MDNSNDNTIQPSSPVMVLAVYALWKSRAEKVDILAQILQDTSLPHFQSLTAFQPDHPKQNKLQVILIAGKKDFTANMGNDFM